MWEAGNIVSCLLKISTEEPPAVLVQHAGVFIQDAVPFRGDHVTWCRKHSITWNRWGWNWKMLCCQLIQQRESLPVLPVLDPPLERIWCAGQAWHGKVVVQFNVQDIWQSCWPCPWLLIHLCVKPFPEGAFLDPPFLRKLFLLLLLLVVEFFQYLVEACDCIFLIVSGAEAMVLEPRVDQVATAKILVRRVRVRRSPLTLSVSQLIDLTEQRNIFLISSFLSYCELHYTQYGVVELFWQVWMCQVPLGVERPGQAAECISIFAVTMVTGWALAHVFAVCLGAPPPVYRVVGKNIDMVMKGAIFSFGIIWKVIP